MSSQTSDIQARVQEPTAKGLTLGPLTALVVGSMIGAGIFGLPSQMAGSAAPGPLLLGWLITGVGMLALALVFQRLANARPDVEGGVYGYARAGFGDYVGYTSAWGYWISAWIGNVSYFVLLFATLGTFFPVFGQGNTMPAILAASIALWVVHALVLRGVQGATVVNLVVTIAKVVPLLLFIVVALFAFKAGIFTQDFWGRVTTISSDGSDVGLGSTMDQVRNMMLVTVWVFIGIEGASVYSTRAARRSDVGRATVIGFLGVLALLLAVNVLAYGAMPQSDIAALDDPSLAGVMRHIVGPWGTTFISIGLMISLVGAFLAWVLLCAEILAIPARDRVLPAWLGTVNAKGTPTGALWLTNLCIQVMLVWTYFNASTYTNLVLLASSLVLLPYLWSASYALIVALREERSARLAALAPALVATVYAVWLVYAGGLQYLLVAALAYLIGTAFYVYAKRSAGQSPFTAKDLPALIVVALGSIAAVIGFANGSLRL